MSLFFFIFLFFSFPLVDGSNAADVENNCVDAFLNHVANGEIFFKEEIFELNGAKSAPQKNSEVLLEKRCTSESDTISDNSGMSLPSMAYATKQSAHPKKSNELTLGQVLDEIWVTKFNVMETNEREEVRALRQLNKDKLAELYILFVGKYDYVNRLLDQILATNSTNSGPDSLLLFITQGLHYKLKHLSQLQDQLRSKKELIDRNEIVAMEDMMPGEFEKPMELQIVHHLQNWRSEKGDNDREALIKTLIDGYQETMTKYREEMLFIYNVVITLFTKAIDGNIGSKVDAHRYDKVHDFTRRYERVGVIDKIRCESLNDEKLRELLEQGQSTSPVDLFEDDLFAKCIDFVQYVVRISDIICDAILSIDFNFFFCSKLLFYQPPLQTVSTFIVCIGFFFFRDGMNECFDLLKFASGNILSKKHKKKIIHKQTKRTRSQKKKKKKQNQKKIKKPIIFLEFQIHKNNKQANQKHWQGIKRQSTLKILKKVVFIFCLGKAETKKREKKKKKKNQIEKHFST
ncbi:hypothetical protein RFI_13662 [Reticulomyxa filosa]|uniref:Uncharacterized protein n=1 Tax=Reticulomyxa filosa TaxID=46433 RepID=X6NDU5_RETFI|nr:hypothetical protein RFI_13662 [Reticulomyxa filosa]|eukprot:ETO23517.1 hypothetical protein RFI_13662 [Reticulomyxa filosa]